MRVLYDITNMATIYCNSAANPAGIFRATERLGQALLADKRVEILLSAEASQLLRAERFLDETGSFPLEKLVVPTPGGSGITSLASLRAMDRNGDLHRYIAANYTPESVETSGNCDIRHINWRGSEALPEHRRAPIVAPVFDLISLKHPEWFTAPNAPKVREYLTRFVGSVGAGHHLIVNTEAVRCDVLEYFTNVSGGQVHVVPLGIGDDFHPVEDAALIEQARTRYGVPSGKRYILCVNTLEPRKNTQAVIDAYRALTRSRAVDDVVLVLVGTKGWLIHELDTSASSPNESVVVTGYVPDEDLPALYSGASAFLFPSLDEGFGLPVLEAMKSGVPVVCSNRPPLLEVAGDAALTVDPSDIEAIADATLSILSTGAVSSRLRAAGLERAQRFSWDRSASGVIGVYEQAIALKARAQRRSTFMSTTHVASSPVAIEDLKGAYRGQRLVVFDSGVEDHVPLGMLEEAYTMAVNVTSEPHPRRTWKPTFRLSTADVGGGDAVPYLNGLTGSLLLAESSMSAGLRTDSGVLAVDIDEYGLVSGTDGVVQVPTETPSGFDRALLAAVQLGLFMGFDLVLALAPPASSRSDPAVHSAIRDACAARGADVVNVVPKAWPNLYRRADLHALFADSLPAEYQRRDHASVDETQVIASMVSGSVDLPRVMVDVGAHTGSSTQHFTGGGWRILCFEPEPSNRAHVTTIAAIAEEHGLDSIDFLKIDVEGHDLDVLRGVPWDRLRPAVIECEYEDAKTMPMGHSTHDIVAFLRERGYAVYVSEWHPVIRYGRAHDWRRVVPAQGADIPSNSWGNLLAFRRDPGYAAVQRAFATQVRLRASESKKPAVPVPEAKATPPWPTAGLAAVDAPQVEERRRYADRADRLREANPTIYRVLRISRRGVALLLRRPSVLATAVAILAAIVVIGLVLPFAYRVALWTASGFGGVLAMFAMVLLYARRIGIRQREIAGRLEALESAR